MSFTGSLAAIWTALDGLVYTSSPAFIGTAHLTIEADDQGNTGTGGPQTAQATLDITVSSLNDSPVALADTYTTDEDVALDVPAPGVLANDSDPDGTVLTAVLVTPPAHGSLVLNADGSFSFTPAQDFNGTDSFVYQAVDASDGAASRRSR